MTLKDEKVYAIGRDGGGKNISEKGTALAKAVRRIRIART